MGIAGRNATILVAILLATLPLQAGVPNARFVRVGETRATQDPSLKEVLARMATYVTTFQKQFSGIVAEESYRQEVKNTAARSNGAITPPRKTLKSDLLLVRPPDSDRYIEFRDVFEVNGRATRDRDERLTKLFLKPAENTDQIREIVEESARHNIGDIQRNINTPMLTLYFLRPDIQPRFEFKRLDAGHPQLGIPSAMPGHDAGRFKVTTEMWVLEFSETHRPTLIRTFGARDLPASGRFWVNPESGAVLMSELVMHAPEVSATINVSYQSEPLLGLLLPVEMRERYRARTERVEGIATYGRFRQFQVKTGTDIAKPPGALQ